MGDRHHDRGPAWRAVFAFAQGRFNICQSPGAAERRLRLLRIPLPAGRRHAHGPASREWAVIERFLQTRHQALALFAGKGYANVGMRELAAALGIACGSLYNHIESKEALLYEFIEELYEVLAANARRITPKGAPAERLRAILHMHLCLHERMPQHLRIVEHEWLNLGEGYRRQAQACRARYEALLAACLPAELPQAACASSLVSLLNQAPAWVTPVNARLGQGWGMVEAMVEAMLGSLKPTAAGPRRSA